MATHYRPTRLARERLRDALRGRRTTDSTITGIQGGRAGNQRPTGDDPCSKIWYSRNIRSDELLNVEGVSGRIDYLGVCPLCDKDSVHYHVVVPTERNSRQAVATVTRKDARGIGNSDS